MHEDIELRLPRLSDLTLGLSEENASFLRQHARQLTSLRASRLLRYLFDPAFDLGPFPHVTRLALDDYMYFVNHRTDLITRNFPALLDLNCVDSASQHCLPCSQRWSHRSTLSCSTSSISALVAR